MAIIDLGLVGSASNKTSGTTLAITNSSGTTIVGGTTLILSVCFDNHASATAATVSPSAVGGVAWTQNGSTVGSGATTTAGTGIWLASFRVKTSTDITNGSTITTITFGSAVVAKTAVVEGFVGVSTTLRGTVASGTSISGAATATTTGTAPAVGDLIVGTYGAENNAAATPDSDTTGGAWDAIVGLATTGGSTATNVAVGIQDKETTAAGNQTYNPTSANDMAVLVFALVPDAPIAVSATEAINVSITEGTVGIANRFSRSDILNVGITEASTVAQQINQTGSDSLNISVTDVSDVNTNPSTVNIGTPVTMVLQSGTTLTSSSFSVNSGDIIVVFYSMTGTGTPNVTDSQGNTYTFETTSYRAGFWTATASATGSMTVTLSTSDSGFIGGIIWPCSNAKLAGRKSSSANSGSNAFESVGMVVESWGGALFAGTSVNTPDTEAWNASTDNSYGTWGPTTSIGTNSGGYSSNNTLHAQTKILTDKGLFTYAPYSDVSVDWWDQLFILQAAGTVSKSTSDSLDVSVTDVSQTLGSLSASDALNVSITDASITPLNVVQSVGNRPSTWGAGITTASTSWTTNSKPGDITLANGDVIFATVSWNSRDATVGTHCTNVSGPDGTWIQVSPPRIYDDGSAGVGIKSFYHVVTNAGTEPSTFTFTPNASARGTVALIVFRNVDTTSPLDVTTVTTPSVDNGAAGFPGGVSQPFVQPGLTTVTPGSMIVGATAFNSATTYDFASFPAGTTTASDWAGQRAATNTRIQDTASATGTWSWVPAVDGAYLVGFMAALRPQQPLTVVSASDALNVSITDVSAPKAIFASTDALNVSITDTVTQTAVTLSTTDALNVSITDTTLSIFSTLSTTDALNVSITDTTTGMAVTLSTTDALNISITDTTVSMAATLSTTDVLNVSLTESVSFATIPISTTDALNVSITDVSSLITIEPASDALNVSITESSSVVISGSLTVTASDALNVSVTDVTTSIAAALATTDALNISITDTVQTTFVTLATTDALNVSITDATNTLKAAISTTDALNVSITDTSAPKAIFASADALNVSITDTSNINALFTSSDTINISITETTAFGTVLVTATDALNVSITDVSSLIAIGPASDALNVSITETANVVASGNSNVNASDTLNTSITETSSVFVRISSSDSLDMSVTEARSFGTVAVTATESLNVSVTDVSALTALANTTDTINISITDASSVVASGAFNISASDGLNMSVTDTTSSIAVFIATSDALNVSITDATTGMKLAFNSTEAINVSITDNRTFAPVVVIASDALNVSITDSSTVISTAPATDALNLSFTETANVVVTGVIFVTASDALNTSITDATTAVFGTISTSDALNVSITENRAFGTVTVSTTDALNISLSEQVAFAPVTLATSDTMAISITDASVLKSVITATDSLSISLDETSSVAVLGLHPVTASDDLGISLDEQSTLDLALSAFDAITISVTETHQMETFSIVISEKHFGSEAQGDTMFIGTTSSTREFGSDTPSAPTTEGGSSTPRNSEVKRLS